MSKPITENYPTYFQKYIDLVEENDLFEGFEKQQTIIEQFLASIPEEKCLHAYAENKWTIKEVIQHLTDTERIFCYRALCIARGEKASLPSFDENEYTANSYANEKNWQDIVNEFLLVRQQSVFLFKSFNRNALVAVGISNNKPISVDSIGFILLGHFYHHKNIIVERYL
jgi:DinB superfamily